MMAQLSWRRMTKKAPPPPPEGLNGEHSAMWGMMMHLNSRIDGLSLGLLAIAGLILTVGGIIIGLLALSLG